MLSSGFSSQFIHTVGERERVKLTPREREVLHLVAEGLRNKEIARSLGLSEATVKLHIARVFEKLDVNGRTEALGKALQLGIIALS